MCVQVTKTVNRFEISSLLEKILFKKVRWCLTFIGLYILCGYSHNKRSYCLFRMLTLSYVRNLSFFSYPEIFNIPYRTWNKGNNRNSFLFVISWQFKYDTNGQLSTKCYDKRDDFNFANINLEYGVYFSQLIRSILSFEFNPFTTLPYSKFQRKGEVRTKTKKHEQTGKEAVHIEALDVVREVLYSQVIILKTIAKVSFETSLLRN